MLTDQQRDRICVTLVRARNPQNIGAVARAMHDFGLTRLRVVNEFTPPFEAARDEAARSAVDASAVLADAVTFLTLAEAIADCTLIVGTTAVGERDLQHPLLPLAQAAPKLHAELAQDTARIALLFGSEKTGLSNEELSHCHWLLTIPMHAHPGQRHASMNLGQAVAVCLYEMVRDPAPQSTNNISAVPEPRANAAELERLATLFHELLERTEYTRHHPANSDIPHLRRLVLRLTADATDAVVWMGILRQALWKLRALAPEGE